MKTFKFFKNPKQIQYDDCVIDLVKFMKGKGISCIGYRGIIWDENQPSLLIRDLYKRGNTIYIDYEIHNSNIERYTTSYETV